MLESNSFNLSATANLARTVNAGSVPTSLLSTPAHSGDARLWSSTLALRHSNYFWFGVLSTTTVGTSFSGSGSDPYTRLPQGTVRVASLLADGGTAIRTLTFGGSPTAADRRAATLEALNQSVWYQGNNRHAVKVTSNLRYEHFHSRQATNQFGTFSFASLGDVEAGRPESFQRTLKIPSNIGGQLSVAGSIGDSWRPTSGVQVQYGLRIDANRLLAAPPLEPEVAARFDQKTDRVPNGLYASPRLGFQWIYGKAPVILTLAQAARPPRALIQGGIGIFQNVATAQSLLDPVLNSSGGTQSTRVLQCIGSAAPIPAWGAYADSARIPSACADGNSSFAANAPSVTLYDSRFRQPRSLRANLGTSGPLFADRLFISASAQYQRAFDQPAAIDANLDTAAHFTLDNEGARPVFVDPSSILATGAIGLRSSRYDADFGRVTALRSALQQESRLVTVGARPVFAGTRATWSLTYTWQDAREQYLGFASAARNLFSREWSRALSPRRHTVLGTFYYNAFDLVRWNGFVAASSGAPFTPVVLGDVNGDGNALNDRAFVFSPRGATDSMVAAGLRHVLGNAPSAIGACLRSQENSIAGRGSCHGPWQIAANVNATLNSQKLHLPQRARITVNVNNPLVLADIVAHGEANVRGWGQQLAPDPVLLVAQGFDPNTRRFRYAVNERFGSTRPNQGIQRGETFLALGITYDLGVPRERQLLTQRLDVGRTQPGAKFEASAIKAFGTSTIPNPIALILQQPDSLGLTRKQADSLTAMNRSYTQLADSVWGTAARYLVSLPDRYDRSIAAKRYVAAREITVDRLISLAPHVWSLLTARQRRMLPPSIRDWLDVRVLRAIRSSTSG